MELTVFYAWQSDTHQRANHYLIRDALDDAIKALNADLKVEEPIRLDHDTKGKTGTPHVADTILQKIRDCSIFVADVTCAGKTWGRVVDGKRQRKRMPNPNVMLEVGYASALIPWGQIILVMNTAFGGPEKLPFDLKFRRFPIQYALPAPPGQRPDVRQIKQRRTELVGQFKTAIGDIIAGGISGRRAEDEARLAAQHRAARQVEVTKERDTFERKVLDNAYYNFKSELAVMAASLSPLVAPTEPIPFSDEPKLMRHFQPPGVSSGYQVRHRPKSVTLGEVGEPSPHNMVELTNDGRLFMARNLAYGQDNIGPDFGPKIDPTKRWTMPMQRYQWQFVDAIWRYLKGLIEFGIAGPWFFSVSMLKMKHGILVPVDRTYIARDQVQPWSEDNMHADLILIPADLDFSSEDAVFAELKPPLREIWRHNGYTGVPIFTDNGFYWG